MSRTNRRKATKHLKPTEIPEEVIDELALSLGVDTATAVDLILSMERKTREAG
jgi:hypothetical protein